jgi:hypothetical protein
MDSFIRKVIIRFGLVIVAHYVGLLPMLLTEAWLNYLVPSRHWFLLFPHLVVMAFLTLFGVRSVKLMIVPLAFLAIAFAFGYPQIRVILDDLHGDWLRLIGGLIGPYAYVFLSSLAFFLLYQRYADWADIEVRGAKA